MSMKKGQPFPFGADYWNPIIAAATRGGRTVDGGRSGAPAMTSTVAQVRNQTGTNCPRFGVIKIDGPCTTPTTSEAAFLGNGLLLDGIAPAEGEAFAITLQAIPHTSKNIGFAVVAGVAICKITIADAAHKFADAADGDMTALKSVPDGPASIIWKESGTGAKWAIVRLGQPREKGPFMVTVEKTGGADGTGTTAATWTYTVRSLDGTERGTGVEVVKPRPNGSMVFQVASSGVEAYGLAFYDGADLKLWDAGELPATDECA